MESLRSDMYVTPGERVGEADKFEAGYGVCQINNILVATLVGTLVQEKSKGFGTKPTLKIKSAKYSEGHPLLPDIGSKVTAKVIRVTPRAASVEILVIDGKPVREVFKGTINQQDVRQTEVDKVEIYKCFALGDIVLAEVISLGDRHSYFLSTAKNELGVIHAKSKAGVVMMPVNWQEMLCPATNSKEFRKVAKES
ncbi:Exosome complex component CSL4 [Gracilariopsis chorda]|uniref:Exosome complex component CSL4 n=1 Tax=Gracilariopsis chorda TaxID=448386 RepID=A0A2V3J4W1_9FLOR|nr:Exosome complex component CSL4 [Gracilariopsis chorda]|eukprot:PXF49471.1 Exosome complex component CSL4 [Gracilariopsis chorda]